MNWVVSLSTLVTTFLTMMVGCLQLVNVKGSCVCEPLLATSAAMRSQASQPFAGVSVTVPFQRYGTVHVHVAVTGPEPLRVGPVQAVAKSTPSLMVKVG